jgi:hypothetical protein
MTLVALAAVTVSVDVLPDATEVGLARIWTVGAGAAPTETLAVAIMLPEGPVAVAV